MKIPSVKVCVPRNTSYNGLPDAVCSTWNDSTWSRFWTWKEMIILDSCYTVSVIFVIVNICLLYLVLGLGLGLGREMILTTSHKVSAARSQGRPSATHQNKNALILPTLQLLSNTINPCTSINN